MEYFMDVVFVIDVSKSMTEYLDVVKQRLYTFLPDLNKAFAAAGRSHSDCRAKIIAFRNYSVDKDSAMQTSPFFILRSSNVDNQNECLKFKNYVNSLDAHGGDFDRNNALEALSIAIKNEWSQECLKRRHYIVLFTSCGACKLEDSSKKLENYYPLGMPHSLAELTNMWMAPQNHWICGKWSRLNQPSKRLLMFAPQVYPWPELYESWDQVVYNPSKAGEGIDDAYIDDIVNAIVASV